VRGLGCDILETKSFIINGFHKPRVVLLSAVLRFCPVTGASLALGLREALWMAPLGYIFGIYTGMPFSWQTYVLVHVINLCVLTLQLYSASKFPDRM